MPIYEYYCPACDGRFGHLARTFDAAPPRTATATTSTGISTNTPTRRSKEKDMRRSPRRARDLGWGLEERG